MTWAALAEGWPHDLAIVEEAVGGDPEDQAGYCRDWVSFGRSVVAVVVVHYQERSDDSWDELVEFAAWEQALREAAWERWRSCSGDTSCTCQGSPSCPGCQTDHTCCHSAPDSPAS